MSPRVYDHVNKNIQSNVLQKARPWLRILMQINFADWFLQSGLLLLLNVNDKITVNSTLADENLKIKWRIKILSAT